MNNLLENSVKALGGFLENHGFSPHFQESNSSGSCSVNLDSSKYVGTITYWPEDSFEFQFNSCSSGDVVLLKTEQFSTEDDFELYFRELVLKELN